MQFADILVCIDASRSGRERMQAALALGAKRVVGYYLSPTVGYLEETATSPLPGQTPRASRGKVPAGDLAEQVRAEFENGISRMRIEGSWVLGGESADLADVIARSRCADLVVVGLPPVPGYDTDRQGIDIETLVIESGRPVLGLPLGTLPDRIGSNVVVAWDGSRAATRALHDSLSFLRDADSVRVVSLETNLGANSPTHLTAHLRRMGISATIDANPAVSANTPEDEILMRLQEPEVDLLVAGAFGHSRLKERLFGGASRTFLHQNDGARSHLALNRPTIRI